MSRTAPDPVGGSDERDGVREADGDRRETPRERLAFWTYASAERLGAILPERVSRWVFRCLSRAALRALPGVRATVSRNMARVLGASDVHEPLVEAATKEAFDLYGRYWLDTFRLRIMPPDEVERRFVVEGIEQLDEALRRGKGVVAVLPHMGNWDAAGRWLGNHGYRIASVAERLRPERLAELFLRHRRELGMRIIPLEGNGVGTRLASLLADNWIVGLVADRDLTGRGVEVEMFGATRRLPVGPAVLSLQTGAPLIVCPINTTEDGWRCVVGEPLSVEPSGRLRTDAAELTRLMAREFERAIAARPADWHMFQPGWDEP